MKLALLSLFLILSLSALAGPTNVHQPQRSTIAPSDTSRGAELDQLAAALTAAGLPKMMAEAAGPELPMNEDMRYEVSSMVIQLDRMSEPKASMADLVVAANFYSMERLEMYRLIAIDIRRRKLRSAQYVVPKSLLPSSITSWSFNYPQCNEGMTYTAPR